MRAAALLVALPVLVPADPALAQSGEGADTSDMAFELCIGEVDGEALIAHGDAVMARFAAVMERVDAACAAGRQAEAEALFAPVWADYLAHPEAARFMACVEELEASLGVAAEPPDPCDTE